MCHRTNFVKNRIENQQNRKKMMIKRVPRRGSWVVPQCVSCIAASKLFVCIEKKKLETFFWYLFGNRLPLHRGHWPSARVRKIILDQPRKILHYRAKIQNTESIAGLRIFVAGLEKRSSGSSRVYGTHNPPIYL